MSVLSIISVVIVLMLLFYYSCFKTSSRLTRLEEKNDYKNEYEEMDEVAEDKMCNKICYDCDAWEWCQDNYRKDVEKC
jgi:hypothetical protein